MDLQDPTSKMSTTGGTEQGTVLVLDDGEGGAKKVDERGHRLGSEVGARRRQAGDLEPDRDPRRGPRRRARPGRGASSTGSGYGDFKGAVADAVVDYLAPVRERYDELRADEARARADPRGRRREGAGDRGADAWPRFARRWGRPSGADRTPVYALGR